MKRKRLHEDDPAWKGHASKEKARRHWERKRRKKSKKGQA